MTENLTEQYKSNGYAVYLPSLQKQYAQYAIKSNKDTARRVVDIPKKFKNEYLNFLDKDSELWHCGYALYSCGQFEQAQIRTSDIVQQRNRDDCVIVGDSGGFQLGTGKVSNKDELAHLEHFKNDPAAQYANWQSNGFRERTLKWLERYTDYAMTLDMVLWAEESYAERENLNHAKSSQLKKLSVQQLIDLSVDNLRYFSDYRGLGGRSTKFLSVLQDIGGGTGDAWYDAVKGFQFEGWALGSETGGMLNSVQWLRRLLYDKNLDNSEWIHTLGKSPPVNNVVYTAAQKAIRKQLGRDDFTISLDSSSPHQLAGVNRKLVVPPNFSKKRTDWKIEGWQVPMDIRLARNEITRDIPFYSPLSKFMTLNDFMAHDIDDSDYFTDTWAEQMLVNHNIYMFHRYAIDACDIVFDDSKKDWSKVPDELIEIVELLGEFYEAEEVGAIEARLAELFKPFMKKSKKKNSDSDEEDMLDTRLLYQ